MDQPCGTVVRSTEGFDKHIQRMMEPAAVDNYHTKSELSHQASARLAGLGAAHQGEDHKEVVPSRRVKYDKASIQPQQGAHQGKDLEESYQLI